MMLQVKLSALLVCTTGVSIPGFPEFIQSHNRGYKAGSSEYETRRALYEQRIKAAEAQNSRADRLWTAGTNEFWDWTDSEISSLLGWSGGARPEKTSGGKQLRSIHPVGFLAKNATTTNVSSFPVEKNWYHLRTANIRRNQGPCGSCWALAAATTLQAASEIHGRYRTFSVQEIVNCVPNPRECGGQGGCRGATVELAMDWVLHHGLAKEDEIPYEGADRDCTTHNHWSQVSTHVSTSNSASAMGLTGWETLPQNKYFPLMDALVNSGPVAVSVAASGWVNYWSGIYDGCPLDSIIDHAVTCYGYGKDHSLGRGFWHIQNSWGRNWGEGGRIRMLRRDNDETMCGINNKPELGTGCKGGPSHVTVCGMCGVLYDSVVAHFG